MINQRLQTSKENPPMAKQNGIFTVVAQEIVKNEVDDIVADGMDICDMIDSHHSMQPGQNVTSNDLRSLGETIRNTLLEINEIREQNRERRHRQLLETLTKISLPDSGPAKCGEVKTLVDNGSIDINEECLSTTKYQSTSTHVAEDNMMQKESLDNPNKVSESNSLTAVQQQGFDHSKNIEITENLNSLDEKIKDDYTEPSQMPSVAQKKSIKKACSTILGNRKVVTANKIFAVKQNTKEELQQMRAKMLELQRKKMEDRERKKRQMQLHMQ